MKKNEIIELIANGFDPKIISFELGLELKYVLELKDGYESMCNTYSSRYVESHKRMESIRRSYNRMYYRTNYKPRQKEIGEKAIVNKTIDTIEKMLFDNSGEAVEISIDSLNEVLSMIKNIENQKLSIRQSEKLLYMLDGVKIIGLGRKNPMILTVNSTKRAIVRKLLDAIDKEILLCDDVNLLKMLLSKITPTVMEQSNGLGQTIISKINFRISGINRNCIIQKKNEKIYSFAEEICNSIYNGSSYKDITDKILAKAKEISLKNGSVTLAKSTIYNEIANVITNSPDKLDVLDPIECIGNLSKILGDDLAIEIVVKVLVSKEEFDAAKKICNYYLKVLNDAQKSSILNLKKEVIYAYISFKILKCIKEDVCLEEERKCLEYIDRAQKSKNIKLNNISLGKGINGRTILLSEIYH